MNETKFKQMLLDAITLMLKQRQATDKSDKRVYRDTIRAIIKEITRI